MTTTKTGDSPSANTPEKAAAAAKSVDQKPASLDKTEPVSTVTQDITNVAVDAELREAEERHAAGKKLTYQQASLLKLPWDKEQNEAYLQDVEEGKVAPSISAAKQAKREKNQPW
jgi:hypothetical protein